MGQEQTPDEYPDTTVHIGDALWEELDRIEAHVLGNEEAISAEEAAAKARELLKRQTDLRNEAEGAQAEALELIDHAQEIGGDPSVDRAIDDLKATVQQADVERGNLSGA